MSIPALLDALASKLLSTAAPSSSLLQLKRAFVERSIYGSGFSETFTTESTLKEDPILELSGIVLAWEMAQRFDHASAFHALLDRFNSCINVPNVLSHTNIAQLHSSTAMDPDMRLTEHAGLLRFLLRLFFLKYPSFGVQSDSFNHNVHRLTPYSEAMCEMTSTSSDMERKRVGWFMAPSSANTASGGRQPDITQLSMNDTTFGTIWTSLLAKGNDKSDVNLRHPVFSSHVLSSDFLPPQPSSKSSRPSIMPTSTEFHRIEGLGSLFGALTFAHPNAVLKSMVLDDESRHLPKMRIDITGDRINPLELPLMEEERQGDVPRWLEAQRWKGAEPLTELLHSTSTRSEDDEVLISAPQMLHPTQTRLRMPSAIGKIDTVAEWIERTWHGAAGPLPPWRSHEGPGIPVEEETLEWKDRLINRARILNVTAETIAALLADYSEHINSLHPDSVLTANAFCNAVKKFINFWRGELLFGAQSCDPKTDHHTDIQPLNRTSPFDNILPPLFFSTTAEPAQYSCKSEDSAAEENGAASSRDFSTSFSRIVSSSGSYTQIVHLYNMVAQLLRLQGNASRYPVGTQLLNSLVDFCIRTELDPPITLEISKRVLSLSLVPFAKHFAEWIFWGKSPIHKEFFVSASSSSQPTTLFREVGAHADGEHWLNQFSIKQTHVPSFLRQYEGMALKTGLLVRIHRQLEKLRSDTRHAAQPEPFLSSSTTPTLRLIWSISQLQEYHKSIETYILGDSALREKWMHVETLREMQADQTFSVEQSLQNSFVEPLKMQFNWVSPLVCRRLVTDWHYLAFVDRLKMDYFGSLVSAAFDALPLGVDLLDGSASSHTLDRLRVIFSENIQGALDKLGYRLALEKVPHCSGIDVLDNILIEPTYIQWPLSIIITPVHLQHFHSIFILLVKMTRARSALSAVWTGLSEATRLAHRQHASYRASQKSRTSGATEESIFEVDYSAIFKVLHKSSLFCNQLHHFWGQLYTFVINQVVHTSFHQLQQDVSKASHFEDLISAQERYVATVMKSAMLATNSRALMVVVEKTIHLVHKFRQQIRFSLADPSKWEIRTRKQPLSKAEGSSSLEASLFGSQAPSSSEDSLNVSVFEQSSYQPDELDAIVNEARTDFEKCVKFLLVVLLKLLAHGYEPHMAALVSSLNWNRFYFSGAELIGHEA